MTRNIATLAILAFLPVGCKTSDAPTASDSSRVLSSASRDDRYVETALKSYEYELNDFSAYQSRQDPNEFFEDFETKQRTNFVNFDGSNDTHCVVGLTTEATNSLKGAGHLKFSVKTNPPGRTSAGYRSEIFFVYKNEKTGKDDQFLASCTQSSKRVAMGDFEAALGEFIRFRAAGKDAPVYDVCCECKTDTYQIKKAGSSGTLLVKGEKNRYWMDQSNDSVCQTSLIGKKYSLRPGDAHFSVAEERYQVWTACEQTKIDLCPTRDPDASKKAAALSPSPAPVNEPVKSKQ